MSSAADLAARAEAAVGHFAMPREIAGDGVRLVQLGPHHLPDFADSYTQPASAFVGGPTDLIGAWKRLAMYAGSWSLHGFGYYALLDEADACCGYCGLWFPIEKPEIELGYAVWPHAQGRGLATRAARAVRDVAIACGVPSLVSYIRPDNQPSQRVVAALGAAREGTIGFADRTCDIWRHKVPEGNWPTGSEPIVLEATTMPLSIRTARLLLTQWRPDHFERYYKHDSDPEAQRYTGGPSSRAASWRFMAAAAGQWALRGYGMYPMERDGTLVGHAGFYHPAGWPERELGWHVHSDAQGQGFATEAALAVRTVAAEQGLEHLISTIDPHNAASLRVAERLGAERDGTVELPHGTALRFVHPMHTGRPLVETATLATAAAAP